MLSKMRRPLREAFNVDLARYRLKSARLEHLQAAFEQALTYNQGVAISENRHGDYAIPIFMTMMMPFFKSLNVVRKYTEMAPAAKQDILNAWQKREDEDGFPDHLDLNFYAYSERMWQHYWHMFLEARESDIKIVGLDKPEIRSGYGAVFDAPFKTMFWESVIDKDLLSVEEGGRYIIYGGESHIIEMGGDLKGIHQRMDIPRIMLQSGDGYGIARLAFDKNRHSYVMQVPKAVHQDPMVSHDRTIRSVPVRHPMPEKPRPD